MMNHFCYNIDFIWRRKNILRQICIRWRLKGCSQKNLTRNDIALIPSWDSKHIFALGQKLAYFSSKASAQVRVRWLDRACSGSVTVRRWVSLPVDCHPPWLISVPTTHPPVTTALTSAAPLETSEVTYLPVSSFPPMIKWLIVKAEGVQPISTLGGIQFFRQILLHCARQLFHWPCRYWQSSDWTPIERNSGKSGTPFGRFPGMHHRLAAVGFAPKRNQDLSSNKTQFPIQWGWEAVFCDHDTKRERSTWRVTW